jgi:hypothetical protein
MGLTGKIVKGILSRGAKRVETSEAKISDELNSKHEDMIKAIQARRAAQIPNTEDVTKIVAPEQAAAEAVKEMPTDPSGIRPEFQNLTKDQKKAMIEKYKQPNPDNPMFPEGIQSDVKTQPKAPVELPESEDEAINTIMKLIKESKKPKK